MNPRASPFWRTRFWQQWVVANAVAEFVDLGAVAALGFMVGAVHGWFLLHMVFPPCTGENTA